MSATDTETVLNDLLLLLGIEGVTLWRLRCLAAYLREVQRPSGAAALAELISGQPLPEWQRRIFESHPFALGRLKSDLRGFDAVWTSAYLERRRRIEEVNVALCEHRSVLFRPAPTTTPPLTFASNTPPTSPRTERHAYCADCNVRLADDARSGRRNQPLAALDLPGSVTAP